MTDLQKDLAIYQAMCEIAQKYFNQAVENNGKLHEFISNKYSMTLSELEKDWSTVICDITFEDEEITVDTFHCKFSGKNVFDLMKSFKSLAKVKGDYLFTYEEEIQNKFIGSVDITLDNPTNAKSLTNYVANDMLRPVYCNVLLEVNTTAGHVNIVATNGKIIGVISNNPDAISTPHAEEDKVFQALFTKDDWKRICDHARKTKSAVTFKIYERGVNEDTDTMVAVLGDAKAKSTQQGRFFNWKGVIPKSDMQSFHIRTSEVKAAQDFVKRCAKDAKGIYQIYVSFYKGSDLVYFDHTGDFGFTKTASFHLTQPSEETFGVCYDVSLLQKIKFTGFVPLAKLEVPTFVEDMSTDLTILTKCCGNDIYVRDVENREVIPSHNKVAATVVA